MQGQCVRERGVMKRHRPVWASLGGHGIPVSKLDVSENNLKGEEEYLTLNIWALVCQPTYVQIPVLPLDGCVTLETVPQFFIWKVG